MRIATFLPHVGVFGGVRRFLELGNTWTAMGHAVTLYQTDGTPPAWLPYSGQVKPLTAAADETSDVSFCADPHTWEAFLGHRASTHVFYCVLEGERITRVALREPRVRLAANSGALRRKLQRHTRQPVLDGIGGINLEQFRPAPGGRAPGPLRVLVNGRRSKTKKGTDLVLAALRGLEREASFEIVLFDTVDTLNREDPRQGLRLPPNARFVINPSQPELVGLYQSAHLFLAAERKAGWCNTALEALACGAALVCSSSGTRDFARNGENALVTWRHPLFLRNAASRVLRDEALRLRLAAAGPPSAEPWTWETVAAKLLAQLGA